MDFTASSGAWPASVAGVVGGELIVFRSVIGWLACFFLQNTLPALSRVSHVFTPKVYTIYLISAHAAHQTHRSPKGLKRTCAAQ